MISDDRMVAAMLDVDEDGRIASREKARSEMVSFLAQHYYVTGGITQACSDCFEASGEELDTLELEGPWPPSSSDMRAIMAAVSDADLEQWYRFVGGP